MSSAPRPPGFLAWFHAASVGEANAALPVIDTIAAEHPEVRLLLTTATVTSAKLARARLPKGALHQYVPLDNQGYVQRFLHHWRPDLAVLVESEIWPNLVLETKAQGIPLLLINGRMSTSSFQRWRRRPGMSRPLFSSFDLVLAQNDRLAERFTQLGVTRALDVGNLKADAPPPPADLPGKRRLAAALSGRTVLLAASTHQGEEDMVAAAHLKMKPEQADLLTIIVPRHPERGPLIAEQLRAANLRVCSPLRGPAAGARHRHLHRRHDRRARPVLCAGAGRLRRRLARAARRTEPGRGDQARRRGAHRSQLAELPRFLHRAAQGRRLQGGDRRGEPR